MVTWPMLDAISVVIAAREEARRAAVAAHSRVAATHLAPEEVAEDMDQQQRQLTKQARAARHRVIAPVPMLAAVGLPRPGALQPAPQVDDPFPDPLGMWAPVAPGSEPGRSRSPRGSARSSTPTLDTCPQMEPTSPQGDPRTLTEALEADDPPRVEVMIEGRSGVAGFGGLVHDEVLTNAPDDLRSLAARAPGVGRIRTLEELGAQK